jgi:alpha-beta hydrolase superfamily lysophospholipase
MKKRTLAVWSIASIVGTLAAREFWQRQCDHQFFYDGRDYWRLCYAPDYVRWADSHLTTARIPSGELGIHLDIYTQDDPAAPIVILAHGMLTYGRLLLPLVRSFYSRGYTVIVPDQPGNGYSSGIRGAATVGESTACLVDTALWARQHYDGPLYLMGISLGGPLAYAAAAAGAPISALACVDLFTFDDHTSLRKLVAQPWIVNLLPLLRILSIPFGWVRLPVTWLHRMENVISPDENEILATWTKDPLPPHETSLRALVSAAYTPPVVPLERNTIPTLVLNQECDKVLDPAVTRTNYDRLGGPKRYVELTGAAHWSFRLTFFERIVSECDTWFDRYHTGNIQANHTMNPSIGAS